VQSKVPRPRDAVSFEVRPGSWSSRHIQFFGSFRRINRFSFKLLEQGLEQYDNRQTLNRISNCCTPSEIFDRLYFLFHPGAPGPLRDRFRFQQLMIGPYIEYTEHPKELPRRIPELCDGDALNQDPDVCNRRDGNHLVTARSFQIRVISPTRLMASKGLAITPTAPMEW